MRLHLPEPPAGVAGDQGGGLVLDHEVDAGLVLATLEEAQVLGDAHYAVRVVPSKIRPHKALGDDPRVVDRDPDGHEQVGGKLGQLRCADGWQF